MTVGRLPSIEGGIQPTIVDAKGDLITAVAADTPARIPVGANDTVLTADSTTATGLKWATAGGGGMTLLSTTTLTVGATSTTISSISQSYDHLIILLSGIYTITSDDAIQLRFNSDAGTNYGRANIRCLGTTVTGSTSTSVSEYVTSDRTPGSSAIDGLLNARVSIYRYTSTGQRYIESTSKSIGSAGLTQTTTGYYAGSSAISSVTISSGATFSGGTVYIYGVK